MNNRKLSPRRQPQKAGKIIRAITKKGGAKKHRAVAAQPAAGFNDDGTSLSSKIVGGLFVLLLLHFIAIGAMALHSKHSSGTSDEFAIDLNVQAPVVQNANQQSTIERVQSEGPRISENEAYTWVHAGETYASVASRLNVNVDELKRLNKNRALKAGLGIKVPTRKVGVRSNEVDQIGTTNKPTVNVVTNDVHMITKGGQQVEVSTQVLGTNHKYHVIKSGESFYKLHRMYGVSVDSIIKANPNVQPTKIRPGDKIRIPQ